MAQPDDQGKIRVDKWLWHGRFFKTRTLAAKQVSEGRVRVNGDRVTKPAHNVAPGDVLTFAQARNIRVIRVLAPGTRRGPAAEAQQLYEDLTPAGDIADTPDRAGPRPTKKDRRAIESFKGDSE